MGEAAVAVAFATLGDCEREIEGYRSSYQRAGQALLDIYEQELWRDGYGSFDEYVEHRWDFKRSRATQLMQAGKFLRRLSVTAVNLPTPSSEKHFRPLLKIRGRASEDDDKVMDRRINAWQIVCDKSKSQGFDITEKAVEATVMRFYKGGERAGKRRREVTLEALQLAFQTIAECGFTPKQAVDKFGSSVAWEYFAEALKWMEKVPRGT